MLPPALGQFKEFKQVPPTLSSYDAQGVKGYDFNRQTKNYQALEAFLNRNKIHVDRMDVREFDAHNTHAGWTYMTGGRLLDIRLHAGQVSWHKYENGNAQSGTNSIKIAGNKIPMTRFVRMTPRQQDELLA